MAVFIAISVVDTFSLTDLFERFVIYQAPPPHQFSYLLTRYLAACKLSKWLTTLSQISSAWLVMLFTLERFISVRFPLKRAIICTKRRINIAIISIIIIAAIASVYELYYYITIQNWSKIIFYHFTWFSHWKNANSGVAIRWLIHRN